MEGFKKDKSVLINYDFDCQWIYLNISVHAADLWNLDSLL